MWQIIIIPKLHKCIADCKNTPSPGTCLLRKLVTALQCEENLSLLEAVKDCTNYVITTEWKQLHICFSLGLTQSLQDASNLPQPGYSFRLGFLKSPSFPSPLSLEGPVVLTQTQVGSFLPGLNIFLGTPTQSRLMPALYSIEKTC